MRVLFLTGREGHYPRNQVLLAAFRRFATVDVVAPTQKPRSLLRQSGLVAAQAAPLLLKQRYDLVFVGFYGHLIVRLIAPLLRCPLLFDAFVSTYDTLCFDRQIYAPASPVGRAAYALDRSVTHRADGVLLDTAHHVDYFVETFQVDRARFAAVPVGCSDAIFTPSPLPAARETLEVLYYSTFLPLHGIDVILQAAARLQDAPVRLRLIGDGPAFGEMQRLAEELALTNVRFEAPVAQPKLAQAIADADLCLGGHFYAGGKASRVIPGKIYQMLAVGRPIIAADAPGNRELLVHDRSAFLIPPADPEALARAVRLLAGDEARRHDLADAGRSLYANCCTEAHITGRLQAIAQALVTQKSPVDIHRGVH